MDVLFVFYFCFFWGVFFFIVILCCMLLCLCCVNFFLCCLEVFSFDGGFFLFDVLVMDKFVCVLYYSIWEEVKRLSVVVRDILFCLCMYDDRKGGYNNVGSLCR